MIRKLRRYVLESSDIELNHDRRFTHGKVDGDEQNQTTTIIIPQLLVMFDVKVISHSHSGVLNGFTLVHFCL